MMTVAVRVILLPFLCQDHDSLHKLSVQVLYVQTVPLPTWLRAMNLNISLFDVVPAFFSNKIMSAFSYLFCSLSAFSRFSSRSSDKKVLFSNSPTEPCCKSWLVCLTVSSWLRRCRGLCGRLAGLGWWGLSDLGFFCKIDLYELYGDQHRVIIICQWHFTLNLLQRSWRSEEEWLSPRQEDQRGEGMSSVCPPFPQIICLAPNTLQNISQG